MEPRPASKPRLSERLKTLLAEYGKVALVIYIAGFVLVYTGFLVAIGAGVSVEGAGESAGLIGAAWVATKLTQPIRILATLGLTPIAARAWNAWKKRKQ